MKVFTCILASLVGLFLLVLLAVVILLSCADLQTSLANRFAPDGVSIERAYLGFKGLTVDNVLVEEDGMVIRVERMRGDFSLLRTLTKRHLHLNELIVANAHVDLSKWEAPREPEPAPPRVPTEKPPRPERPPKPDEPRVPVEKEPIFEGLFREALQWPPLSIDQLAVNADIILPGGHQTATVELTGQDIRADVQPEIRLAVKYADSSDDAAITHATLENVVTLSLSANSIIEGIQMVAHAEADTAAKDIREQVTLAVQLNLRQQPDASGEDYQLTLTLYPATDKTSDLLNLKAALSYDAHTLSGTWGLAADTRTIAAVVDPILLGAFATFNSEGTFTFDLVSEDAAVQGTCTVRAEQLDQFQPELATVPTFLLESVFDLTGGADQIEIGALHMDVFAPSDTLLVTLRAEQAFGFDLDKGQPIFGQPDEPLARLTIAGIPVDLINAYLPDMRLALSSFTGDLMLAGTDETLQLSTVRPLTLEGLFLEQGDAPVLENLTLSLSPTATYAADTLSFDLDDMPRIRLDAPLSVKVGPETTDLHLELALWTADESLRVELKGNGKQVFVDHFLLLADAFQSPDYTPPVKVEEEEVLVPGPAEIDERDMERAEKTPRVREPKPERAPEPEPEPQPLWAGIEADIALTIEELILPGHMIVHQVSLQSSVEKFAARLNSFTALLGASPARAQGGLHFRPDQKDHYHLQAGFSLQDFDVGAFLREADPGNEPMMDAIVSVTGDVQSAAPTPEQLADHLTGHFSLVADHAVVRAFQRGLVSRALDVATTAGRIGGLVTGRQDVEAVSQLVTYFNKVVFDEMVIEAQRNPDLSIDLTRLLFRNPDLLIQGHGAISHVEEREFHQQPIALHLEMGARPPLAALFDDLKLLQDQPNELGYRLLKEPIEIEGNVGEPDPRPLWKIIVEAGTQRLLPRLLKEDENDDKRDRRRAPLDRLQQYL